MAQSKSRRPSDRTKLLSIRDLIVLEIYVTMIPRMQVPVKRPQWLQASCARHAAKCDAGTLLSMQLMLYDRPDDTRDTISVARAGVTLCRRLVRVTRQFLLVRGDGTSQFNRDDRRDTHKSHTLSTSLMTTFETWC